MERWDLEFALLGVGLALAQHLLTVPFLRFWNGNVYSVLLEVYNLFFFFLFCRGFQLRDCLESQKRRVLRQSLRGLLKLDEMHFAL